MKYETGDKKPEGMTWAAFYKDAIKNVSRKSQSIVINLKGYEEKSDDELHTPNIGTLYMDLHHISSRLS